MDGQRTAAARRRAQCRPRGGASARVERPGGAGAADQPNGRRGDDPPGQREDGRAEVAALFGSAVLDQYGIAASAEFIDMRALDSSY